MPRRTLSSWEALLGLVPSIRKSSKKGPGGHRWSMKDAINISVLKTLSDWKVPLNQLREAARLLKTATLEDLENAWIVQIEKHDLVLDDVVQCGLDALGLRRHEETGQIECFPVEGESPEDFADRVDSLRAMSNEDLGALVAAEGAKHFEHDARRHFDYRLVTNPKELGKLIQREGVDCRVHHLRKHVEHVQKTARAMGFPAAVAGGH